MSGPTPVSGSSLMIRNPDRIIARRSRFESRLASVARVVPQASDAERRVEAVGHLRRREREEQRGDDRQQREQPEVAHDEQQADAGAGADPGVAAERGGQRHDQRRHDQRRPQAIVLAEQDARRRHARDQHQLPGVGHVMPERPCGRWPRLSNSRMPNWTMPIDGADRAGGDDHVDDRQRRAARRAGGRRSGTIEKSSSCLQSMRLVARIDREERRRRASRRRRRRAARTCAGASNRSWPRTITSEPQHAGERQQQLGRDRSRTAARRRMRAARSTPRVRGRRQGCRRRSARRAFIARVRRRKDLFGLQRR